MAVQKIYAGAKLRELRARLSLTQKGVCPKAGRVAALSEPDGKQQPPRQHIRGAWTGARIRVRRDRIAIRR